MDNIKQEQFHIDDSFLMPEVRCGFYIPSAVKQAWAAQLKVLAVIDDICKRHGIKYFADWGTLLGAVRHAGYIPWDDDLDICMKREDYIEFCRVAADELPEGFGIQKFDTQENFWLFLARVVNSPRISFEPKHLEEFNGFPYIACIDIFVLDYMYKDQDKENKRREQLVFALAVAEELISGSRHAKETGFVRTLEELEKRLGERIPRKISDNEQAIEIYRVIEKHFGEVPEGERGDLTQMMPWGLKGKGFILPAKYYETDVRLPFEMTTIPVPYAYDAMLSRRYGNYLRPVKDAGGHDYPYFEGQKRSLEEVMGFKVPEYEFEPECLKHRNGGLKRIKNENGEPECIKCETTEPEEEMSGKATIRECLGELKLILSGEDKTAALADAQELAITIGNYIENVWYEGHPAVQYLEEFCNEMFTAYEKMSGGVSAEDDEIVRAGEKLAKALEDNFLNKKEILFLYSNEQERIKLLAAANAEDVMASAEIYFVRLPYYKKRYDGAVLNLPADVLTDRDPAIKEIPADVSAGNGATASGIQADTSEKNVTEVNFGDYNLELRHPDRIYIAEPYDNVLPCVSIPPKYYARNLRKYTDELIYVQCFETADFEASMYRDMHNAKYYVCTPGVLYADKVYVPNEKIREHYLKWLEDFSGAENNALWENKITVVGRYSEKTAVKNAKKGITVEPPKKIRKKLFYLIGIGTYLEKPQKVAEKIRSSLELMLSKSEDLDFAFTIYPNVDAGSIELLKAIAEEYAEHYLDFGDCKATSDYLKILTDTAMGFDAYYGDASPFVPLFSERNKPIMIAAYD